MPNDIHNQPVIIIKRVKKVAGGHHGGAWKVAYADFVTAMMAFFLLLWLLNATSEAQKQGIADYFDPMSVSESTSGAGGVMGGQTMSQDGNRNSSGVTALITRIEPDSATSDQQETDESQPASGNTQQGSGDSKGQSTNGGPNSSAISAPAPGTDNTQVDNPHPVDSLGRPLPPPPAQPTPETDAQALARAEEKRFADATEQLRKALQGEPELQAIASQVLLEETREGLRIQLVDSQKKAMFQSGSSRMSDEMVVLLGKIAAIVGKLPNRISIAGHTDGAPYRSSTGYTNWELSADRANSSRRVLIDAGVSPSRIYQVSGRAAADLLNPENPLDPANRRITITLLRESPVLPPGIANITSEP